MKFKVWCPDDEDDNDATEHEAHDAEEAAEKAAEIDHDHSGGDWRCSADYRVRSETGEEWDVRVRVDYDPTFTADRARSRRIPEQRP